MAFVPGDFGGNTTAAVDLAQNVKFPVSSLTLKQV